MPNWKKLIVSGSAGNLSSLSVDTSISASTISANQITGSLFGTASYASYASNGGVTQLLAGPNITLAPTNGLGQVTITANLSGSTSYNTATGSYGSFYDTTTQTNPVANIPRSMSFNTTDITNGVSISGSTNPYNTYVKTENAGVYNIQFSAQIDKTDSGADEIIIWLAKNGTNLTDSATTITLNGNDDKQVAAWNWFVNSAANDYYQIIWTSADTNLQILAEPANTHPGIPSIILTANRIDQFLSNTGSFSGSFNGNFTGSLFGTASQAVSSSYALSASQANFTQTASLALTAQNANTASYISFAQSASYVEQAQTASYVQQAQNAYTASFVNYAQSASYVANAQTASYVLNAVSSSYALTASYAANVPQTASYALSALSSSYAATASFAYSFPDQGFQFTQAVGSTTWTINHNLNTSTPLVNTYDPTYNQLIPASVSSIDANTTQITFSTTQAGYAIISKGSGISSQIAVSASYAVTASYAASVGVNFEQVTPSSTWTIVHNLNNKHPLVQIYDSSDATLVPQSIVGTSTSTVTVTFSTAINGYARVI